ncbi:MAG: UdgX family uracil-DNA binding protein [Steroidobacteraceae bacterium]
MKPPSKSELDDCRHCDLWREATQGVPGRGPEDAALMLVGEQPGDEEDVAGRPFVGPAGRLLAAVLEEAGIAPKSVYVTNAVKHFKWEPRGKRRLHKRPNVAEVRACNPWLLREIEAVKPKVIVALGATAARGVLGADVAVGEARSDLFRHPLGAAVCVTYHPSAVLRGMERADELREALLDDLKAAKHLLSRN